MDSIAKSAGHGQRNRGRQQMGPASKSTFSTAASCFLLLPKAISFASQLTLIRLTSGKVGLRKLFLSLLPRSDVIMRLWLAGSED